MFCDKQATIMERLLCSLLGAQLPPRTQWALNKESKIQWAWEIRD